MLRFDEEGRTRMRVLGRRLFTLAGDYLAKTGRRRDLIEETRFLGMDYGRELASRNVSLGNAMAAFIFFRNSLHQALKQPVDPLLPGGRRNGSRRLVELEDQVLLGIAAAFERGGSASGSQPANGNGSKIGGKDETPQHGG